jgi:hypothetical protein
MVLVGIDSRSQTQAPQRTDMLKGDRVPGTPIATEVRHPLTHGFYSFGKSRPGNDYARSAFWPRADTFLHEALAARFSSEAHRCR